MATVAKAALLQDAARVRASYGGSVKMHAVEGTLRWPTLGASRDIAGYAVECSWSAQRLVLKVSKDGDSATFSMTVTASANASITSADTVRFRHLRVLYAIGMENCAQAF